MAGMAWADAGDTLNLTLSETLMTDSNLFRLPTGLEASAPSGRSQRSDRMRVDAIGLTLDKTYSLQRFHVDTSYAKYRFATFNYLDYSARNGSARWTWALTPRLTGNLSVDQKQSLNSFADFRNFSQRNVNTTTGRNADLDFLISGGWHLTAGASRRKNVNTVAFLEGQDYDNRGGQAGLRYVAADGDYLAWQMRLTRGLYPAARIDPVALTDTAYRQVDHELLARWTLSGHSLLEGRVTELERRNANFAVRDYRGTAGRLDYTWTPTGKTHMRASAARDYGSYVASNSSYRVTDTLTLAPAWQVAAKTLLRLKLDRIEISYLGSPGLSAGGRADRQRSAQLSFDWTPTKALTLAAGLQRDARRSTAAGLDYDDTSATLTVQLAF